MKNIPKKTDRLLVGAIAGCIGLFILLTCLQPHKAIAKQSSPFSKLKASILQMIHAPAVFNTALSNTVIYFSHTRGLTNFLNEHQAKKITQQHITKIKTLLHHHVMTTVLLYKTGTIHKTSRSFRSAARHAGFTAAMYRTFVHLFSNHINFRTDLHAGDHFSAIYQAIYRDGRFYKNGPILLAQLATRNHIHRAVYYQYKNHQHYYSPKGHLLTRTYLWQPLHYKRISGHFTYHRFDPVLHVVRPHLGIDYAAKWGTPIHSISDGKIIFRGRRGGYGNAVLVRYSRKYKVLYGHMSAFARHLQVNEHVRKGQVLGYVGSTGWSTGPHLHFEFYVHGVPTNPAKIHLPHDHPIPYRYLHQFRQQMHTLLADLKFYQSPRLADNNTASFKDN